MKAVNPFIKSFKDIFLWKHIIRSFHTPYARYTRSYVVNSACDWFSHCMQGYSNGHYIYYIKSLNQFHDTQKRRGNLSNDLNTALLKFIMK